MKTIIEKSDVLIIGGGFSGVFAALRAKSQGLDVILVDKGDVGRSGQTPWVDSFHVFDANKGHSKERYREIVSKKGLGLNNPGFLEMLMEDSKEIFEELKSWGAVRNPRFGKVLKKRVLESGTKIINRTMITHLVKDDEEQRIIGAMGFPLDIEDTVYVFEAKAVVNCAGAGSYKSHGFPIHGLTFDGDAISYRVGAQIIGKEFNDFHSTMSENPGSSWFQWGGKWGIGLYEENMMMEKPTPMDGNKLYREVASGNLPIPGFVPFKKGMNRIPVFKNMPIPDDDELPKNAPQTLNDYEGSLESYGGASAGMSVHKAEGIFPKDGKATFESCVKGLYAAGDALGSMLCGANYSALGFSSAGSAVQGSRAGLQVAEYCKDILEKEINQQKIEAYSEEIYAPLTIGKGYSARWVIEKLQNLMIPFYVIYVKEEKRLECAIQMLDYIKNNLIPKIYARDMHELKLAHEAANMVLNAEMKLKSGLFRKETRGSHYREDYPETDSNWDGIWVSVFQGEDGEMKLEKVSAN